MKYTWAIIVSTIIFAGIGLIAAFGMAEYSPRGPQGNRSELLPLYFGILPLVGAFTGLVIGCAAASLGHRYSDRRGSEFESYPNEHFTHARKNHD
jgi:hypothetical protein